MNAKIFKVAFIQDVEIEIEIDEEPQMEDENSNIFYIDDVINVLHDRDRDEDKKVVEYLRKLRGNDVDMVAVNKSEF